MSRNDLLICPICQEPLVDGNGGKSLYCSAGHCFDVSASGYVNLTKPNGSASGDSKEMIRARRNFLAAGYYFPIADAVLTAVKPLSPRTLVDAGCGEGYYTSHLASGLSNCEVLGFDLSKPGIDIAAKAAKHSDAAQRLHYFVAGIFELPVRSGSVDAVVNMFAPIADTEFHRVLSPDGALVVVVSGVKHLWGLKKVLYDTPYENDLRRDKLDGFQLSDVINVNYKVNIEKEHIFPLFCMTPYYFRTTKEDKAKLEHLDSLETEIDADILIYRKV